MIGNLVNVLVIILGTLIGLLLKEGIKESYKKTIMDGIGLCVIVIGISSGIKSENLVLLVGSLVVGSIIGEYINIEKRLMDFGEKSLKKFSKGDSRFLEAFVTSSLIYTVGAMAIIGAMEAGIHGNYETLYAKAILDGITSIILGSTMGIGVMFSALPVFIYQGTITLFSSYLKDFMTPEMITEISAVGGVLIMGIGLNVLGLKKIKIGNLLPATLLPILYFLLKGLFI